MKTITEYQPMIFSQLAAVAEKRGERRRQVRMYLGAAAVYTALGLGLSFDTGFVAWNWQFWVMFAPFLAAGELATRELGKWKANGAGMQVLMGFGAGLAEGVRARLRDRVGLVRSAEGRSAW